MKCARHLSFKPSSNSFPSTSALCMRRKSPDSRTDASSRALVNKTMLKIAQGCHEREPLLGFRRFGLITMWPFSF